MSQLDLKSATDAELLACFAAGRDRRAFAELVARHGAMVLGVARRQLRHEQDAEDAYQATFLALAQAAGRRKWQPTVAAWLHQTVVRSARSIGRSNGRWQRRIERQKDEVAESYTMRPPDDALEILDKEIRRLPTACRAAVVLCDLEGLSRTDAAARLRIPTGTLKTRLTRGRQLLQIRLVRRGVTLSAGTLLAGTAKLADSAAAITPSLIHETTTKAVLFAAGRSAADVGVSAAIAGTAQGVISAMTVTKFSMIGAALAIVFGLSTMDGVKHLVSSVAVAKTIFYDGFDDGDATDGSPVAWYIDPRVADPLGYQVVGSDYFLTQPTSAASAGIYKARIAVADVPPISDTSIRAQVKQTQGSGPIAVLARVNVDPFEAYQGGIDTNDNTVYISRNRGDAPPTDVVAAPLQVNPSLEDVLIHSN